ncbi:MAG TPA: calcium-binding EGF-like domain-containing protein [Flavipsychrobacter sp.]|nr:calcium-binding EGF-like domain-containing protein [Flavipsychrobacter sp.]
MKRIALSAMLTIGAFGAVTYTACNKDECKDVVCLNGGTCSGGNCSCQAGYEGNRCETLSITKFVKVWSAADQIGSTNLVYTTTIAPGPTATSATISNSFSDDFFANTIAATVNGNTITIADQKPDANGDYRVQGSGTYQSGKINWSYSITQISTGSIQNYTGTWQ